MSDDIGFGEYFRLVLIDYPEGRDLQRWPDVWNEDRPDPAHIDESLIKSFLVQSLKRRKKFMEEKDAEARAAAIVRKAAEAPPLDALRTMTAAVREDLERLAG